MSHFPDDYEAVQEANREAALDWLDEHGVSCEECGHRWDPGYRKATRTDPAYLERDYCPDCGGGIAGQ